MGLEHNKETYSEDVKESIVSEEQNAENQKSEEEEKRNALEKERQLELLKQQEQKEELKREEEKIQQEQKRIEAEIRKKEDAEKEVEKDSTQIKGFLGFIKEELKDPITGNQLRKKLFLKLICNENQTIEDYLDTLDCKSLVSIPPEESVICDISEVYDSIYFENLLDNNSPEKNSKNDTIKVKSKQKRRPTFDELQNQFKNIKTANNRGSDEDEKANSILVKVNNELEQLTKTTLPQKQSDIESAVQEIKSTEKNILDITKAIKEDKDQLTKLASKSETIKIFLVRRYAIHKSVKDNSSKLDREKNKLKRKQIQLQDLESKYKKTEIIIEKYEDLKAEINLFINNSRSTRTMHRSSIDNSGHLKRATTTTPNDSSRQNNTDKNWNTTGLQQSGNQYITEEFKKSRPKEENKPTMSGVPSTSHTKKELNKTSEAKKDKVGVGDEEPQLVDVHSATTYESSIQTEKESEVKTADSDSALQTEKKSFADLVKELAELRKNNNEPELENKKIQEKIQETQQQADSEGMEWIDLRKPVLEKGETPFITMLKECFDQGDFEQKDQNLSELVKNEGIHLSQYHTGDSNYRYPVNYLLDMKFHKTIEAMILPIYNKMGGLMNQKLLDRNDIKDIMECYNSLEIIFNRKEELPKELKESNILKSFEKARHKIGEEINILKFSFFTTPSVENNSEPNNQSTQNQESYYKPQQNRSRSRSPKM